jgi:hypothetical protein
MRGVSREDERGTSYGAAARRVALHFSKPRPVEADAGPQAQPRLGFLDDISTGDAMSYVDDHLLPGEQVEHRGHLHRIIYVVAGLLAFLGFAGGVFAFTQGLGPLAAILIVVASLPLLAVHITYTSSEFAVTDKRVIIKVGWIRRRTLETMLNKVENIGVDQTVYGRLLDFGTITVTGTGGTKEAFADIAEPLEFRRQVQAHVSAVEEARAAAALGPAGVLGAPRDERDCPYCAERILTRARVCKHCGRDVEPLPAT